MNLVLKSCLVEHIETVRKSGYVDLLHMPDTVLLQQDFYLRMLLILLKVEARREAKRKEGGSWF